MPTRPPPGVKGDFSGELAPVPMGTGELELFKLIQQAGEHAGSLVRFLDPAFEGTAIGEYAKQIHLGPELKNAFSYVKAMMEPFAGKSEAEIANPTFKGAKFPEWAESETGSWEPVPGKYGIPDMLDYEGALDLEKESMLKPQIEYHKFMFKQLNDMFKKGLQ